MALLHAMRQPQLFQPLVEHRPGVAHHDAAFTRDMVDTLAAFFPFYEADEVVRLRVTPHGILIFNPHSQHWQFLGRAELTDAEKAAIRERRGPLE